MSNNNLTKTLTVKSEIHIFP